MAVTHIFLIGDAGNADKSIGTQTLNHLSNRLKLASSNSTLLFLGDNIYQKGLPPEDDPSYASAQNKLKMQLKITNDFKGKTVFSRKSRLVQRFKRFGASTAYGYRLFRR